MGPIWLWLRRRGGVCSDEYGWPSESCEFPAWLANTTWIDFDSKQLYNVSADVIYELRAATRNAATARPAAPHARQTTTGELRKRADDHPPRTLSTHDARATDHHRRAQVCRVGAVDQQRVDGSQLRHSRLVSRC